MRLSVVITAALAALLPLASGDTGAYDGTQPLCGGCPKVSLAPNTGPSFCLQGQYTGDCDNSLMMYDSDSCRMFCKPDTRTHGYVRQGGSQVPFQYLTCNDGVVVNEEGVAANYRYATCQQEPQCKSCPDISFTSECPEGRNCGNELVRFQNDRDVAQYKCKKGFLATVTGGSFFWGPPPYCSSNGTWSNTTLYPYEAGFFSLSVSVSLTCTQPKACVQCTVPETMADTDVPSDFTDDYEINSDKLVVTTDPMDCMRIACKDGFKLAAFSANASSDPSLSFEWGQHMQCSSVSDWLNSGTATMPADAKVTCAKRKARCLCDYKKDKQEKKCGCQSSLLAPVPTDDDCQLECPEGYHIRTKWGGKKRYMKWLKCQSSAWGGWFGWYGWNKDFTGLDASPKATCVKNKLHDCPRFEFADREHCNFERLFFRGKRLSCEKGFSLVVFGGLNVLTPKFIAGALPIGFMWRSVDIYGAISFFANPYFACWEGEAPEPEVLPDQCEEESCDQCSWFYFRHHRANKRCENGILTVDYEPGTLCMGDTVVNATSISCTAGSWYYYEGTTRVDLDNAVPISCCEGPIYETTTPASTTGVTGPTEATEAPASTEPAPTDLTTSRGVHECHSDDLTCGGCSWFQYDGDETLEDTCVSGFLTVHGSGSFGGHICTLDGSASWGFEAGFCINGNWWFVSAVGNVTFTVGRHNPFRHCHGPSTALPGSTDVPPSPASTEPAPTDLTTSRGVHECHSDDQTCGGCSWFQYDGDEQMEDTCVSGFLTLHGSGSFGGHICTLEGSAEWGFEAGFCIDGNWWFVSAGGNVTFQAGRHNPFRHCHGHSTPLPGSTDVPPSPASTEVAPTDMTTSRGVHECHSDDQTCGGCSWFQYDGDEQLEDTCVSGFLTIHGSGSFGGHVCTLEGSAEWGFEAGFCIDGNWWFVSAGGNVTFQVGRHNPFRHCHGHSTPLPGSTDVPPSPASTEVAPTDMTTSRGVHECHSDDQTCGGCSWFQYDGDEQMEDTCVSGFLTLHGSGSLGGHICSLEGSAEWGFEAGFCIDGNWWFVSAGGNVTFQAGRHNPFRHCHGHSTPLPGSTDVPPSPASTEASATDLTTSRGVHECHSDDQTCGGCSWFQYDGDEQIEDTCVSGFLTIHGSGSLGGHICSLEGSASWGFEAGFCIDGNWWFVSAGGNVTFEAGRHNPFHHCHGHSTPLPGSTDAPPSPASTEVAPTDMTTSRGVHECHSDDQTCGGCSWFQYDGDEQMEDTCVSGFLTLHGSASLGGNICSLEGSAEWGFEAGFCIDGNWWFVSAGGNVTFQVGRHNPFHHCHRHSTALPGSTDVPPSPASTEVAPTDMTTSRGVHECHSDDQTCGGCSWFQYDGDEQVEDTCVSGFLTLHGSGSLGGHVCALEGSASWGFEAGFCIDGNWWFVSAGGNVTFQAGRHNPFRHCHGHSTPLPGSTDVPPSPASTEVAPTDMTTSRGVHECHSQDPSCGGCSWFQYDGDDQVEDSCVSGFLTLHGSGSLGGHVCTLEGEGSFGFTAGFCFAGNWWFVGGGFNVTFTANRWNPLRHCRGQSTLALPSTSVAVSTTAEPEPTTSEPELCREAPACGCGGGDFPMIDDCDQGSKLLHCGINGDIFVFYRGYWERFGFVRLIGPNLWFAFGCHHHHTILIEGELTARCRLESEEPTASTTVAPAPA